MVFSGRGELDSNRGKPGDSNLQERSRGTRENGPGSRARLPMRSSNHCANLGDGIPVQQHPAARNLAARNPVDDLVAFDKLPFRQQAERRDTPEGSYPTISFNNAGTGLSKPRMRRIRLPLHTGDPRNGIVSSIFDSSK